MIRLNNGLEIPEIGFGTYRADESDELVFSNAIEAGYRFFDTASFYKNEESLAKAISESKIPREEFIISSKCWRTEMGLDKTREAFENSCKRLQTDYLDLYLIHWPRPNLTDENWRQIEIDTWKVLEEYYDKGRIKAIGISNFMTHHLDNLLSAANIVPAVNQIEFHPGYMQKEVLDYCQSRNIQMQAWSPLGCARLFKNPLLNELAEKYSVSVAQLCIRFAIQNRVIPLPKSSNLQRMKENMDVYHFTISEEDMSMLANMPRTGWSGEHPDYERVKNLTE